MTNILRKIPNSVKVGIKAVLAISLVYWVIERGALDLSVVAEIFTPMLLLPCLVMTFFNLSLVSERWRRLLHARGVELSLWQALRLTLIGTFFNFAMPGAVGGDVIKGYYITRKSPSQKMITAVSVLVDRLVGFYAMLVMALSVMLWQWPKMVSDDRLVMLMIATAIFFVGFSLFFVLAFTKRNHLISKILEHLEAYPGGALVKRLYSALHVFGHSLGSLFVALVLSILSQFVAVGFFWWIGQYMGLSELSLSTYFVAIPLGFIVSALPLAPAGIGVGQAAFLFFFNAVSGVKTQLGPTGITLFQICLFAFGVWGSVLYMKQKEHLQEASQHG